MGVGIGITVPRDGSVCAVVREKRGLSVEALARRMGIVARRLERIEAGKVDLWIEEWVAFCQALGLTLLGEEKRRKS